MKKFFSARMADLSVTRCQSFSSILPPRIRPRGTEASAERIFITISVRLISSEKNAAGRLWWIAAERHTSSANVDLPTPGRAATMIIWPGCRPLVSLSSSVKPVGTPESASPLLAMASISSNVGSSSSRSDL